MNPLTVIRLATFVAAGAALVSSVALVARRFALYAKGRKEPAPRNLLPPAEIDRVSDARMRRDALSQTTHQLIIVGLVAGIAGHLVSALGGLSVVIAMVAKATFVLGGALLVAGSGVPFVRRILGTTRRFTRKAADIVPLLSLVLLGITGMLLVIPAAMHGALSQPLVSAHVLSAAFVLFCLPGTKLLHTIGFTRLKAMGIPRITGALPKDPGVEQAVETGSVEGARIGLRDIRDLSLRQRIETDTCVSCGLCDDACPAHRAGKALSPQRLTEEQWELMNHANRTFDLAIAQTTQDCTSCYACETACPLFIPKVDRITALRRSLLLEDGKTNPQWRSVLRNCEKTGNVFGIEESTRTDLLEATGWEYFSQVQSYDYVIWLGCYAAFDPNMRGTVVALSRLLHEAGKRVAVFQTESCCGDMARRIGDEYLFRQLVEKNAGLFAGLRDTPLVTLCPHCMVTLKEEYADFGIAVKAVHYTQILGELRVKAAGANGTPQRVAYHDSCYLARLSGVFAEPREFLQRVRPDTRLVPLDEQGESTLCCGGGGARVTAEEDKEQRISLTKIQELRSKGVEVLLTSCPYCKTMFSDAAAMTDSGLRVADLLEYVTRVSAGQATGVLSADRR